MVNKPKETKTYMTKTVKIAIAAAIVAAVVFPGVAALAATTDKAPVKAAKQADLEKKKAEVQAKIAAQREERKKKVEELQACRLNNRKAQSTFVKANLEAVSTRKESVAAATRTYLAAIKGLGADKDARAAAKAARETAIKTALVKYKADKDAAEKARESSSKKCAPVATTNTSTTTTTTNQ